VRKRGKSEEITRAREPTIVKMRKTRRLLLVSSIDLLYMIGK